MFDTSFRSIYEDPDFTQPVQHRAGGSRDSDNDGRAEYDFSAPVTFRALIDTPEASPFEITEVGTDTDVKHAMACDLDKNVTEDDRITFDDGLGTQHYRVTQPRPITFDGDRFAWYLLLEDKRGEVDGDTGDSDITGWGYDWGRNWDEGSASDGESGDGDLIRYA